MMKRMAKYINADLLEVVCFTDQEGSFSDGVQWLLEYIDALPSADVQSVIRCKDCKHWNDASADGFNSCEMDALIRHESFFCANGERKDGKQ